MNPKGVTLSTLPIPNIVNPHYLHLNNMGNVIVADFNNPGQIFVVQRNPETKVLETITHPELKNPSGMAVDDHGNIIIACLRAGKVMVRSPENKWSVLKIEDKELTEFTLPMAIGYIASIKKMYVSYWSDKSFSTILKSYNVFLNPL